MRGAKKLDCFDSVIGWSLVREDCELGLDGLVSALDTLSHERPQGRRLDHARADVIERLRIAIQVATLALDDVRNAERSAQASGKAAAQSDKVEEIALPLGLSRNDLDILQCAAEGMVDKAIALKLKQCPQSVHQRWKRIRLHLGAADRSNAVCIAMSLGMIHPPPQAARLLRMDPNLKIMH